MQELLHRRNAQQAIYKNKYEALTLSDVAS